MAPIWTASAPQSGGVEEERRPREGSSRRLAGGISSFFRVWRVVLTWCCSCQATKLRRQRNEYKGGPRPPAKRILNSRNQPDRSAAQL